MLRKASALEEETKWATCLCRPCNQSIHLTEFVTVMPRCWPPTEDKLTHESLCEIASDRKLLLWFKFGVNFEVAFKQNYATQVTIRPAMCKNMVLPFHLQLLQFQPHGKCARQGGQLACFGDVCWCDAVSISHFLLQMAKVQWTKHKIVWIRV